MSNLTISIFGNQIFAEILNEIKLFSKFQIKFYDNFNLCINDAHQYGHLVVLFSSKLNEKNYKEIGKNDFPLIITSKSSSSENLFSGRFVEKINMPFSILDLEKKIISLFAKFDFTKSSLIYLKGYIINKNERKIKKNNLELKLTEKEVDFLILFSQSKKPLSKTYALKKVWNYSSESESHTIETHIHRLRKKILKKFNDNNFIKNDKEGYFI